MPIRDPLETLSKLPKIVYTYHPTNPGQVIAIHRGVAGYFPTATSRTPEELNGPDVTPEQILACENGSMFGWEIPAADPDYVREHFLAREAPDEAVRSA